MKRILAIAIISSIGAAACAGSSGGGDDRAADAPTSRAVTIKTFAYQPASIRVAVGETVTWSNQDEILHTATSGKPDAPTGAFDGTMQTAGATFSHTFDEPGSYSYFCSRHNGMRGEVVVEA